jgi:hypothetical protein
MHVHSYVAVTLSENESSDLLSQESKYVLFFLILNVLWEITATYKYSTKIIGH